MAQEASAANRRKPSLPSDDGAQEAVELQVFAERGNGRGAHRGGAKKLVLGVEAKRSCQQNGMSPQVRCHPFPGTSGTMTTGGVDGGWQSGRLQQFQRFKRWTATTASGHTSW